MKMNITNLYGMASYSTAQRAQQETAKFARELGANELGIYFYDVKVDTDKEMETRLDGVNASLQMGDMLIFQMPTWNGYRFDKAYLDRIQAYGLRLAIFVQDTAALMFKVNREWLKPYVDLYNRADVLIVSSKAMEERLRKEGLTVSKVVYQEMWDRRLTFNPPMATFAKELTFTGSQERFPFTKQWHYPTKLRLYARDAQPDQNQNIDYMGYKSDADLVRELNRGFGLCWSVDTEGRPERQYSRLNASFKLSTYLAAGMPVVANADISSADLIKEYGLGLLAPDLQTASDLVQNCTPAEYQQMAKRVQQYGYLLRQGANFKRIYFETMIKLMMTDK